MFTDVFPGVVADNLFGNYPLTINVSTFPDSNYLAGVNPYITTNLTQPGLADSAIYDGSQYHRELQEWLP